MTRHTLVLEFETEADIPDLLDHVQQRVYLMDKVKKGAMSCSTLENYLYDARRRLDMQVLPVRDAANTPATYSTPRRWIDSKGAQ